MANFKKELKDYVISAEARKNLTAEQLATLERTIKELMEEDFPEADLSSEKFDAKGMHPVGEGPVRWTLIKDPPPAKK